MELIKVSQNEITNLANLCSEIWHEYWPCILTPEQIDYMVEKFQSEKAIGEQIKHDNYTYYFIIANDEKAGYIGISEKTDYLFLSKLYIKKEFRHQGIGKQAFEEIKRICEKLGYTKIRLTVNKYNQNTIDAYLKYGFKVIDEDVTDIGQGFVMDDYIMEYKIQISV